MRHSLKKQLIMISATLIAASAFAVDKDYYSADLENAIKAAKENSAQSQHVGARWYNRSTSRSFNFPKMMNAEDRKSTRLNSSHVRISYAVFCLKKKKKLSTYE